MPRKMVKKTVLNRSARGPVRNAIGSTAHMAKTMDAKSRPRTRYATVATHANAQNQLSPA